ncbi:peptide deformylase [Candidatus Woesebacteria bacterium]|nr:peptide deformylase [Candidatus Woesebacteria bacterium]
MNKGTLLPIVELGNPMLRKVAKKAMFPLQDDTLKLIQNMFFTMFETNGVGIAAPQVGVSLQIFIVASRPNKRYPYAPKMKPTVMINPSVTSEGNMTVVDWEGCLSVPNIRGLVPCSDTVSVEYQDKLGKQHTRTFSGFPARIIQHEFAHIRGLLFTDRVKSSKDLYSQAEFEKRLAQRSKTKIPKSA